MQNSYIFIQENKFENSVSEMLTILSRPQCVDKLSFAFSNSRRCVSINYYYYMACEGMRREMSADKNEFGQWWKCEIAVHICIRRHTYSHVHIDIYICIHKCICNSEFFLSKYRFENSNEIKSERYDWLGFATTQYFVHLTWWESPCFDSL